MSGRSIGARPMGHEASLGYRRTPLTEADLLALLGTGDGVSRMNRERAARVLWLRHCAPVPLTYRAIGRDLGVTDGRVREIEAKALRMLRHPALRARTDGAVARRTLLRFAVFGNERDDPAGDDDDADA